jgi:hypothetical protein
MSLSAVDGSGSMTELSVADSSQKDVRRWKME